MVDSTKPNYSTQFLSAPIKYGDNPSEQIPKFREEEKGQKAPQKMPDDLNQFQFYTGRICTDLLELKKIAQKAKQNPEIDSNTIDSINEIIDDLYSAILIDMSDELDKLAL
jgi:hypothetical protein